MSASEKWVTIRASEYERLCKLAGVELVESARTLVSAPLPRRLSVVSAPPKPAFDAQAALASLKADVKGDA